MNNRLKKKARSFEIIKGPDKDELFSAFKSAHSDGISPAVFLLKSEPVNITVTADIWGIKYTDHTGEIVNIEGFITFDRSMRYYEFRGLYDTRYLNGRISIF